jgi:hypothetical protein
LNLILDTRLFDQSLLHHLAAAFVDVAACAAFVVCAALAACSAPATFCSLGIARLNVYAGLSGFYFVRERFPSLANGPELPGLPYPAYDGTIDPMLVRELPIAIQDRAFTNESQLWYPVADHPGNNSLPSGAVPPRSLPEFSASVFANGVPVNMVVMTVNGRTYPRQVRALERVFFINFDCLMCVAICCLVHGKAICYCITMSGCAQQQNCTHDPSDPRWATLADCQLLM